MSQASLNFGKNESRIFLRGDLDSAIRIETTGELRFLAHSIFAGHGGLSAEKAAHLRR
jgi:hypothetical protein